MHNPELNHESKEVINTVSPMFKGMTLEKLSLEDLVSLKMKVQAQIEAKRMVSLKEVGVGSKVRINHKRAPGLFTVKKINNKTFILEDQDGRSIKASKGLISLVA
jgi:hypothetical protein